MQIILVRNLDNYEIAVDYTSLKVSKNNDEDTNP